MDVNGRQTHPIVQSIINNNLQKLKDFLKDDDINGVYPCKEKDDDITPLIAAVVFHQEDICVFLLQEGADPKKVPQSGLTPLHYASQSDAPLVLVKRLLEAKAHPDGCDRSKGPAFTPLQAAAVHDRQDIVKELISAGAPVTLFPVTDPEYYPHNQKISEIIHHLAASGDELCSKVRYFLDMEIVVQEKPPEEVFKTFDKKMLLEHPQTHRTMIDTLYNVTGPSKEKYWQGSIEWLREPGNLQSYIVSALCRSVEKIPNEQATVMISQLLEQLCAEESPDVQESALKALYVVTQKTKSTKGWDSSFVQKLCQTVAPFVEDQHSSDTRLYTYGVFANLLSVEGAVDMFTSAGITSVPEATLTSADLTMNSKLKEGLRRLNNHFRTASPGSKRTRREQSEKPEDQRDDSQKMQCLLSSPF